MFKCPVVSSFAIVVLVCYHHPSNPISQHRSQLETKNKHVYIQTNKQKKSRAANNLYLVDFVAFYGSDWWIDSGMSSLSTWRIFFLQGSDDFHSPLLPTLNALPIRALSIIMIMLIALLLLFCFHLMLWKHHFALPLICWECGTHHRSSHKTCWTPTAAIFLTRINPNRSQVQ